MIKFIAPFVLLFSISAYAALTPLAGSLRHYRAITESAEVYAALGSARVVDSITDDGEGSYTLVSADCLLKVTIEAVMNEPVRMVPELKVTVGALTCLP